MKTQGLFRDGRLGPGRAPVAALVLAGLVAACSAAPGQTPGSQPPAAASPSASTPAAQASVTGTPTPEPTATPARSRLPQTTASPSAASPSARPSPKGGTALRSVSFSGASGWIAGDGALYGTRDGGTTWRRAWTGSERVTSVTAVSGSVAWAVLAPAGDGQQPADALLRTANGGTTWTRVALGKPLDVRATGQMTAWAIGRSTPDAAGDLERTTDGGGNWKLASTPSNVDDVCAAGSLVWIASAGHVWLSSDGGSTWAAHDPTDLATGTPLHASLGCSGDGVWLLVTGGVGMSQQAYAVTRSLDRGAHWQVVYTELQAALGALASVPPDVQTIDAYSGPFAVVAPRVARFAGWCPACGMGTTSLVATDDGGATSRHVNVAALDGAGAPAAIAFADASHGWLLGSQKPVVLRTRDGGATWSQVKLP